MQPASSAAQQASASRRLEFGHPPEFLMWLILLEALLALGALVFIVWWTMFQKPRGRRRPPP